MKAYGGNGVTPPVILATLAADGEEWSASRAGGFTFKTAPFAH
jgi:hypothetical protein